MVDKKTLNKLGLAVVSAFATIIPVVLALQPDDADSDNGDDGLTVAAASCLEVKDLSFALSQALLAGGLASDACVNLNLTLAELIQGR